MIGADARPREEGLPAPHVLVVALGSSGDMYPFLRIARDLGRRGHRVTMIGPQAHAGLAAAAGVPFHGVGTEQDYANVLVDPDLWHPRKGFSVIWRGLRDALEVLNEFLSTRPPDERCGVLAHPLALPAASLARAERPGLRIVAAWLAPTNLRTVHDPLLIGPLRMPRWVPPGWRRALWRALDATLIDPVALRDLNAARARHGLPPAAHFIDGLQATPEASITLFPPWFAPTPADWPTPMVEGVFPLFDPHPETPLAPAVQRFLDAGEAPIVFTPGSGHRQAARWFDRALVAVGRLGRRAVFLTPHRGQVPAHLPPDVLWWPYVPLAALLQRAAALVHHGGIGTTAEALRAGVPQLILALAYDQFDNGARVEALEAGRLLSSESTDDRRLAGALTQMLRSDALRAGCASARRHVQADATVELAARVEALLGLSPPPLA